MDVQTFDFDLPTSSIPAQPRLHRDGSRMLVVDRRAGTIEHRRFVDFPSFMAPGDVVVLNDTRVIPTVLRGVTHDGAQVAVELVSDKGEGVWDCAVKRQRPLASETLISFAGGELTATVVGRNARDTGTLLRLSLTGERLFQLLDRVARYMLPLYLNSSIAGDAYQTIYAARPGSNQPPVAGMHFTQRQFDELERKGVAVTFITLNIGRLDNLSLLQSGSAVESHLMYPEAYSVSASTASLVNAAKDRGNRVIAVGTTVTRVLETVGQSNHSISPGYGWTNHYIYPGYQFNIVDALLSNLQPPKTTNLFLACAFGGQTLVMRAYREAVSCGYQFLEFGDAALYL